MAGLRGHGLHVQRGITRRQVVASGLSLTTIAAIGGGVELARHTVSGAGPAIARAGTVDELDSASAAPAADASPSVVASPTASARSTSDALTATTTSLPSPQTVAGFSAAAAAYLKRRSGIAGVAGLNLNTGAWVEHHPTTQFLTASIVKVSVLVTLLLKREAAGRELTAGEKSLARRMITSSDNAAADALWSSVGGATAVARTFKRFQMTRSVPGGGGYWGTTRTTPTDQLRIVRALVDPASPLSDDHCSYARDLMHRVIAEQRWGITAAGGKGTAELKNGWLPAQADGGLWVINSIGRVVLGNGDPALLAVLSRRSPSMSYGITTIEHLAALAADALY